MKFGATFFLLAGLLLGMSQGLTKEVTIYSVYPGDRLEAIFKPFTARTGITVNVVDGSSKDLINRIIAEGENTLADLHLDKDLVYHGAAVRAGIYQPFKSVVVEKNVPANFIESNRNWFTLFYRSRVIMYNPNVVSSSELSTYEALGDSKWKGRLCVRTSKNSYNEALSAYLVTHFGQAKAFQILKSWVANFAVEPMANDRAVIAAIAEGKCDVGLANSYYLAPFIEADASYPVKPFFANQGTTNAHVNGVGIGLTKYAKNVAEATLLMEYLSSAEVQAPVAKAFDQYPVNSAATISPTLQGFGPFSVDTTNVGVISNFTDMGADIMIQADYK